MYAPDESSTCVKSTVGKKDSISLFPNSRFINEFLITLESKLHLV